MKTDILILGGGLIGLTLALALDKHGLSSIVVDPADPAAQRAKGFDGRVSAVASAPWQMFQAIGLADELAPFTCPIKRIEVRDGLQPDCLDFTPEGEADALGMMVENWRLRNVLHERAGAAARVDFRSCTKALDIVRDESGVRATLSDGADVRARLLIGAEGRASPSREAAGIKSARWNYGHTAIVTALDHEAPHNNIAHEIFYPAGPFALLPMQGGHRSALVWSVATQDASALLALNDYAFVTEAQKKAGSILGSFTLAATRSTYPLSFQHAASVIAERMVVLGDAAHGIHPIAGQGLNLGFRDVATLVEVLVEGQRLGLDLGDAQLLARYQRWRSMDVMMVAGATDILTRLYGLPGAGALGIRRFGMRAIQKVKPLKDRFMAEARGESGQLPRLLQGELV